MNTVSVMDSISKKHPKTTTPPPKGNGAVEGFLNNPILGGAGDATLSPRVSCEHTPDATLGAVHGPTVAPRRDRVSHTHTAAELVPAVIADFTRILLSEAASRHLSQNGQSCFAVTAKASWPDDPTRWVLYLVPCSIAQADAAVRVARGLSLERKPKAKP